MADREAAELAADQSAPLRAELLSMEGLAERARVIAAAQRSAIARHPRRTPLGRLLTSAGSQLAAVNATLAAGARGGRSVSPAMEWLLDNYYLVDEQVRTASSDLPTGYGAELPRLTEGPLAGYPRIYEAAVALIAHTDARGDADQLERFIMAFQEVSPLSIGEMWAVPIVLRVALVEDLRRLALRVAATFAAEQSAEEWADRLLTAMEDRPAAVAELLASMAKGERTRSTSFLVRLRQRMADQERDVSAVTDWVERAVRASGREIDGLTQEEQQRQASDQVSIANAISAIRFVDATDWRTFFERCSVVEAQLRRDPAGIYACMDFASRDRYRHALEELAKRCPVSEPEIARAAVEHAEAALKEDVTDQVRGHVGYYLISGGRYGFEQALRYRPRPRERAHRSWLGHRGLLYWGGLALATAAFALGLVAFALGAGAEAWGVVLLVVLALVPLSELSLGVVNRLAAVVWPPRTMPKLDSLVPLSEAHRTLVAVPALLTSASAARSVIDNLEIHYLGNEDPNLGFALLGDLKAATEEHTPADAAILQAAREGIAQLNERYGGADGHGPFHLFVRSRTFNQVERAWMGWERKRGALTELGRLLRGAGDTSITLQEGDASFLPGVMFVITLDADTILPRDTARRMVCAIAHPLSRARVDADRALVTGGYGLVQPRVGMSLPSATATLYALLNTGPTGLDPYAGAVSDTYQDVFGEGSFTGKGIFEVDVFNAVLAGRFPENRLLSHDLIEGCFLRTALASDVEVLDDFPGSYLAQCARVHRWVRGDWQILPWLGRTAPGEGGVRYRNPLSPLHKWKIADNLRRSVFPATWLLLGSIGWLLMPRPGWIWPMSLALILGFQALMHAADSLLRFPRGVGFRATVRPVIADLGQDLLRALVGLAVLPHQAVLNTDAATRALWRSYVSRRALLEWTTAAEAERLSGMDVRSFTRAMAPSALLALVLVTPALLFVNGAWMWILPAMLLWALSPVVAWSISRPLRRREAKPSDSDIRFMRRVARKTWRFFETFVGPQDRWLPPDNYQEDPKGEIAHRTSPTNMGLLLIANMTAHDLGYLSTSALVDRVSSTLGTMVGLERFLGHFYNWYDTRTLEPLRPRYVSTVDSGNLAGHLIALRSGLCQVADDHLVGRQALDGITDGLRLALEDLLDEKATLAPAPEVDSLHRDLGELLRRVSLAERPRDLGAWHALLDELWHAAEPLVARTAHIEPPEAGALRSVTSAFESIRMHRAEIGSLVPWAGLVAEAPHAVAGWSRVYDLTPVLSDVPSLAELAEGLQITIEALGELAAEPVGTDDQERAAVSAWAAELARSLEDDRRPCVELLGRLRLQCDIASEIWEHTDFAMLYDEGRELFSIGFNTEQGRLDDSYYDMLASECRLASYLAIARGQVPQEHWFRLGRQLTRTSGGFALLSWSASMFEYLMPLLVMNAYPDTLLDLTYGAVVRRQQQYGSERGVPWGVSESAFAAMDAELTYQYQAFGVPGLGLKRGLSDDIVIAPYATMLAMQVDHAAGLANLRRLTAEGAEGPYGYYEALDYTPGRVPAGQRRAVVKTYMAHHQGMGLVALGNELTGGRMRARFHADPLAETAELLLQERVPRHMKPAQPHVEEVEFVRSHRELPPPVNRSYPLADTPTPATHFLSNGRYSVMVTNAGGGYSRWLDNAVSRYREDITRDCWGQFCFIRDTDSGAVWSNTFQPSLAPYDEYHCILSADRAEFRRRDGDIETYTEVVVSPEDDVEVRRVAVTNHGISRRTLELTSYFEVALTAQGADQAHRAFSNLFVETEALPDLSTLVFTRRPRSADEQRVWGLHTLATDDLSSSEVSWETDRARFVGRLRHVPDAIAMGEAGPLSGTVGPVLDPVCALRRSISVGPGETVRVAFATGVASSREEAVRLAERYADVRAAQRAVDLAWSTSQIELRDLGITPDEAVVFQRLASRLLLTDPYSRLKLKTLRENTMQVSGLWGLGISGDHPVLLVKIERIEDAQIVRQALLAHQYWRHKGFRCDLVILNTKPSAYHSDLDDRLHLLARTGHALQMMDKPAGVFIRRADQIAPDVLNLLESVARATVEAERGPILLQLNQRGMRPEPPDPLVLKHPANDYPAPPFVRPKLEFDNGYGGFDPDSGEYVIVLEGGETTPAPWVNVIAYPEFGTMVSEAGVGCTWALNSHENRLTTWNNDAVSDGSGEMIYVRDEETGEFWSPTPLPVHDDGAYVVRHGHGYSTFEHACHGIGHTLTWFVPPNEPVRVARLRLENLSGEARKLSVTQFVEWVLGDSRSWANQRVVTSYDTEASMLTAHSWMNEDFPGRVAFLACDAKPCSYTASRTEFLGRNGVPRDPAAMHRKALGQITGRFHDNCGALMSSIQLAPGEVTEVRFLLGQAETLEAARALARAHRAPDAADRALDAVRAHWEGVLGAVKVTTPDRALDALVNGPVLYQTLACRIWGRTALYQSSGAFGFRDQLQDVMALTLARPDLTRAQIVRAARHQFEAGDVLHWWQPYSGRGVRTRFTDDRCWLPFVTCDYIEATGDVSVLDEVTPYLTGPELQPGHEDLYLVPGRSQRDATVYEHCIAALEASRGLGAHGLPLMGGGDWNDGMNRVGIEGRGESVWMAWFLRATFDRFARLCELKGDAARAAGYRAFAAEIAAAAEREAWDGAWYRRAYFDDGTPLGTKGALECRIDAIAQAWAVISGGGAPDRTLRALESVEEKLISWEDGLVALLTPPFDHMPQDPGYIKGYVPGVRENGGQYTHAAIWVAMAYALEGDGDEALGLLDLINPLNHSLTKADADVYRVEPYVIAADVYAAKPHVGRGGWTWYTGSASWYYNVAVRTVLGIRTTAEDGVRYLVVDPCIPKSWPAFSAELRIGATTYSIRVDNPRGVNRGVERVACDGSVAARGRVALSDDGRTHQVVVTMLGG